MDQALLTAAGVGLVCALIIMLWTRARGQGFSLKSLVIWIIGFAAGQQAIDELFSADPQTEQRTVLSPGGFITFEHDTSTSIGSVGVSHDGKFAFTTTAGGALRVLDTDTGMERWTLNNRDVSEAVFSPHGHLLAVRARAQDFQPTLQIFSIPSGRLLGTLQGAPANEWSIDDMVFSHNGDYLLVASTQLDVAFYTLGNLAEELVTEAKVLDPVIVPREVKLNNYSPHRHPSIGFSADDRSIFVLGNNRRWLERWSVAEQPRQLASIRFAETTRLSPTGITHDGQLAFECDMRHLRLAPTDATSTAAVLQIKVPVEMPPGSYNPVTHCDVSPDRKLFILGISNGSGKARFVYTVNLWKTDGTFVMSDADPLSDPAMAAEAHQVGRLAFTPDSNFLYAADDHMQLRIYALSPSIKVAIIPAAEMGFADPSNKFPLLAVSNQGVVLSYHGASKAVWVPSLSPPSPLAAE